MNKLVDRVSYTECADIVELLGVLSESLVKAKTPTQRLAIMDEIEFVIAQLPAQEETDA
jgi:hypothetical protein